VTSSRNRWLTAAAASLLCLGAAGSAQAATGVTGLSDLRIGKVLPAYGEWTPTVHTYANIISPQVTQARYQVRWDVADLPAGDPARAEFVTWLAAVQARGMRPLVSFMPQPGSPPSPSKRTYQDAFALFRVVWPQITEFTAWNEPNHANYSVPESSAVDYFEAITTVCGSSCTVAAGDFSGNNNATHTYWSTYKSILDTRGLVPRVWAYHPYEAINRPTSSSPMPADPFAGIRDFLRIIGGSQPIWFTEVGAYLCRGGESPNYAEQDAAVTRLNSLIANPANAAYNSRLTRVYYYQFAGGDWNTTPTNCPRDDYGLINHYAVGNGAPRPAMKTLFPQSAGHWWSIRNSNTTGVEDRSWAFQPRGVPVPGDFNFDGADGPGTFDAPTSLWSLGNTFNSGPANRDFFYGFSDGIAVMGDWDGNGSDTPGLYKPSTATWYLRNDWSAGAADLTFAYGFPSGLPVVGDWDGDGDDTIGVFDPATAQWFLRNSNDTGANTVPIFYFGVPGDTPLAGDWDGNRTDTPGIYKPATAQWFLRNNNTTGVHDVTFYFGVPGDWRVTVGDWDGNGSDTPGVVR
jgi:hypothetical protein